MEPYINSLEVYIKIDNDVCPQCMDHIEINDNRELGCQHNFCKTCIDDWLTEHCLCPLCGYNVNGQIEMVDRRISIEEIDDDYPNITSHINNYNYENIDYNLPAKLLVYAHSYNILRIMSGIGGLQYSK